MIVKSDSLMNLEEKVGRYANRAILYVDSESTLQEVAFQMAERGTDVAVVRSRKNRVMGLITTFELFDALRSYVLGKDILENVPSDLRSIRVQELMRAVRSPEFMEVCRLSGVKICFNIGEDDTVANAIRVLAMSGISHLLVTRGREVVGTLCAEDLLRAFTD